MKKNENFSYQDFLQTFFISSTEEEKMEENPFEYGASISSRALNTIIANLKTTNDTTNKTSNKKKLGALV